MGNKMTREEELKGLESVCSFLGSMSDDERFEYLMKNSKSFKKEMEKILPTFSLTLQNNISVDISKKNFNETTVSVNVYRPITITTEVSSDSLSTKESPIWQIAA